MGKVLPFEKTEMTVADHREMRLRRELKIESEQHDKTLATLTVAVDKIESAGHLVDACDVLFEKITGFSPDEYLRMN